MTEIVNQLHANGFRVVGRYITKKSSTSRNWKTVGLLNDTNFYFFSDNVYPYKSGVNFLDNSTLVNPNELARHREYVKKEKEKEQNEFEIGFDTYFDATSSYSVFVEFLENKCWEYLSKRAENYFDLRGISIGRMGGAVAFPFIDYNNNFVTAQIIKYGSNGKRIKDLYSTNWLHTYKPIKERLGLDDATKYSKSIKCFFGENYLNGSTNTIAIVEAPKTAVILKEIYPNIDWIATAGEQALFNKDIEVLKDRNVILFPDAQTTKWKQWAESNGFICSDILDEYNCEEGSDLADFIFDSQSDVFTPLHNLLFSLNVGDFDFQYNEDKLEFNFSRVADDKGYFTAVPYTDNLILYSDNSNNFKKAYKGRHFDLYEQKYSVLNAQIDWHKQDTYRTEQNNGTGVPCFDPSDSKHLKGFNEKSFIWHLQKCYRTLKHLNPNKDYLSTFEATLSKLNTESNFRFSEKYVLRRLVPIWDSVNVDIKDFKKHRNWKYKGNEQLSRKEFERYLNDDRFRSKLLMRLYSLQDALKEGRYIFKESDIALDSHYKTRGFGKLGDLINKWNKEVIGCTTENQYFKTIDFIDKMKNVADYCPLHIESTYRVVTKVQHELKSFLNSNLTLKQMHEASGVSKEIIRRYLKHKPNRDSETLIKKEVQRMINKINSIEPIRSTHNGTTRIETFEIKKHLSAYQMIEKHKISNTEAFISLEDLRQLDNLYIWEQAILDADKERKESERKLRKELKPKDAEVLKDVGFKLAV